MPNRDPASKGAGIVSLAPLFQPRSVAVIGASEGMSSPGVPKMGTAALENLVAHGFAGDIYPVNPKGGTIQGREAYTRVADIPGEIDLALIVLPASLCAQALRECGGKGVKAAIIFASGFSEAGNDALENELSAVARQYGIRFVGPNTAGFVDLSCDLVAAISMVGTLRPFLKGEIAFVTQSGALGGSMLGRAMESGVGFSHWVATGNQSDIETFEYIEYLIERSDVRVVALFLEGVGDARRMLRVATRAAELGKPIVVYKSGISEVAAAAVASHTGALAGADKVFDGICHQYGLIRVDDVSELFETAQAFARLAGRAPAGRAIGIVSASGGICGVGADECSLFGLDVPRLPDATQEKLRGYTPDFASLRNPVDVTGQIRSFPTGYQDTVRTVLAEPGIDAVLLLITMAAGDRAKFYGEEIPKLVAETKKPVIVSWVGPLSVAEEGYRLLNTASVPVFLNVRQAIKTLRRAHDHAVFQRRKGYLT